MIITKSIVMYLDVPLFFSLIYLFSYLYVSFSFLVLIWKMLCYKLKVNCWIEKVILFSLSCTKLWKLWQALQKLWRPLFWNDGRASVLISNISLSAVIIYMFVVTCFFCFWFFWFLCSLVSFFMWTWLIRCCNKWNHFSNLFSIV